MKILFVDDFVDAVEAMADLAILLGHEARVATTAAEAEDVAGAWSPDLMVIDIWLGIDDGRDVCRALRLDSRLANCKMVALTGAPDESALCEPGLFDGRLTKPLDFDTLAALLDQYA